MFSNAPYLSHEVYWRKMPARTAVETSSSSSADDVERQGANEEPMEYLSKYDEQILQIDKVIEPWYFIVAGGFTWLLLAGFLMSPSTYASVQEKSNALQNTGSVGKSVMTAVRNVPLIYLACFACLIATVGLVTLWRKWKSNIVWVNRYLVV